MTTHSDVHSVVEASERLCGVLDQIGDALVDLDLEALLMSAEALAALVAVLPAQPVEDLDPAAVAAVVRRARAALLRCRRLGTSFGAVARARLPACAGAERYGRGGDYVDQQPVASTVKVRA